MLNMTEMMEKLEREYPNRATVMLQMSEYDKTIYLAKVELIESMKMWNEPQKPKTRNK